MSMFNDISWGSKENERECELSAQLVSMDAKRFSPGKWSFLGPGSEKKWCSINEDSPQGEWDKIAEQMMLTFAESGHPAKVVGNYQYTFALTRERLKLFFAQLLLLISSVFTEQSQKCVKNVTLAIIEQGDLLWKDNRVPRSCQV